MWSWRLTEVVDSNRMDSGRFESVSRVCVLFLCKASSERGLLILNTLITAVCIPPNHAVHVHPPSSRY